MILLFFLKALKVLRTSEFLPYVVFIEAPDFEVLKAMNRSAIESGVITKQLTVSECVCVCVTLLSVQLYLLLLFLFLLAESFNATHVHKVVIIVWTVITLFI